MGDGEIRDFVRKVLVRRALSLKCASRYHVLSLGLTVIPQKPGERGSRLAFIVPPDSLNVRYLSIRDRTYRISDSNPKPVRHGVDRHAKSRPAWPSVSSNRSSHCCWLPEIFHSLVSCQDTVPKYFEETWYCKLIFPARCGSSYITLLTRS